MIAPRVGGQCFAEHVAEANDNVLVLPNLETVEAAKNLEQILEVPAVDVYFFGPADFSASAGYAGQWQGPGVAEETATDEGQDSRSRTALRRHCDKRRGPSAPA